MGLVAPENSVQGDNQLHKASACALLSPAGQTATYLLSTDCFSFLITVSVNIYCPTDLLPQMSFPVFALIISVQQVIAYNLQLSIIRHGSNCFTFHFLITGVTISAYLTGCLKKVTVTTPASLSLKSSEVLNFNAQNGHSKKGRALWKNTQGSCMQPLIPYTHWELRWSVSDQKRKWLCGHSPLFCSQYNGNVKAGGKSLAINATHFWTSHQKC